jgi:hypothetical protein
MANTTYKENDGVSVSFHTSLMVKHRYQAMNRIYYQARQHFPFGSVYNRTGTSFYNMVWPI